MLTGNQSKLRFHTQSEGTKFGSAEIYLSPLSEGREYMIQVWKGSYGWISYGAEIGIYVREPGQFLDGMVGQDAGGDGDRPGAGPAAGFIDPGDGAQAGFRQRHLIGAQVFQTSHARQAATAAAAGCPGRRCCRCG